MKIKLKRGKATYIDDADWLLIKHLNWHAHLSSGKWYAYASVTKPRRTTVSMSRLLLSAPAGSEVDHRDGDTLNNRRRNLRLASSLQNARNRRVQQNSKSRVKGVVLVKSTGRWRATITDHGKQIHLGYFKTKQAAGRAYAGAAQQMFGAFARW